MLPSALALLLFLTLGVPMTLQAALAAGEKRGLTRMPPPLAQLKKPSLLCGIRGLSPFFLALPQANPASSALDQAVALPIEIIRLPILLPATPPLLLPITCLYRLLYSPAPAGPAAEEYQVKGAFLLNFAKFVSWPDQAFKTPDDPISICILGQNPFGPGLELAARDLVIGDRHVVVRPSSDVQSARQCQIVFVAASERKLAKALLQVVQGESVLTVGEFEGFTAGGGIIAFKLDGEKIRLDINTAAADRARLRISAKLLSLAQSSKK